MNNVSYENVTGQLQLGSGCAVEIPLSAQFLNGKNRFSIRNAVLSSNNTPFWPYSQNTIINSECKRFFCRVEGEDTHWRLYRLPVVTRRAELQKGGGIARAWIEDPKVYPGIPMPQWWRWVPEGKLVATGGRFVKIVGFLLLILAKLCWLTSWKVLVWRQGL